VLWLIGIQTFVFQMGTSLFNYINYLVDNSFENFDKPNSKFDLVVSQLLQCLVYIKDNMNPKNGISIV